MYSRKNEKLWYDIKSNSNWRKKVMIWNLVSCAWSMKSSSCVFWIKFKETTFIYSDQCNAEIQLEIATTSKIVTTNDSRNKDKAVALTKNRLKINPLKQKAKSGISSIKVDQECCWCVIYHFWVFINEMNYEKMYLVD